jgi:energy-coupling factor transporter ATP-binding protein EcfA2
MSRHCAPIAGLLLVFVGLAGCGREAPPARRVVEVLEIGHLLSLWPRNLSGGESQRVALGSALLSIPNLLLMDEPLETCFFSGRPFQRPRVLVD